MSESTPTPQDDDPYAPGAGWIHDDTGKRTVIVSVFEDTQDLTGLGAGTPYVVTTSDDPGGPILWAASVFISLHSRPQGGSPMVQRADIAVRIPRQRAA